ncbi:cytochrome C [Bordetella bronchiseptica CA90 BB1334]|nr:cytochrome C [Bordetella bronchiseptica MO211]KCV42048.1 cytochrome C [Bordetella bronchiseptica 345]KDB75669.1 cytochrome C [Bordetella bronchiseptica CA90 BB1334]KDC40980.1 cytochrome C [Bordetella bronchiseptica GA96-01]KDD47978.1 cytochrome C [Bordetella bronchiseptica OSU095]KDD57252.1 cytochrome C [Bordetella bronchiseptica OSU553]
MEFDRPCAPAGICYGLGCRICACPDGGQAGILAVGQAADVPAGRARVNFDSPMLAFKSDLRIAMRAWRAACGVLAAAAGMLAMSQAVAQGEAALRPDTMAARVAACTACHGEQGRAGPDGYYPRLAGKPQDYLYHQLLNFRDARRQYPPMAHLLNGLPDAYLREMAAYFAGQDVPYPPPARIEASAALVERGRLLVREGDPARAIPSCASCHGASLAGVAPAIPGLLGLPRDYLVAQIGSWQNGLRRAAEPDCMAQVSLKLTPEDIGAVSAWLAGQPVGHPYTPQPAGSLTLPLECGSQAGH